MCLVSLCLYLSYLPWSPDQQLHHALLTFILVLGLVWKSCMAYARLSMCMEMLYQLVWAYARFTVV